MRRDPYESGVFGPGLRAESPFLVAGVLLCARIVQTELSDAIPIYLGAAVAYLVLVLPAGLAFGALERRVAIIR